MAKFNESIRDLKASQGSDIRDVELGLGFSIPSHKPETLYPEKSSVRRLPSLRGPRKAAEPTGDIKLRLSKANEAFIYERYEDAAVIILEIIRINAETYEAWTILSTVLQELGRMDDSVMALIYASHLRPKDVVGWLKCASFALNATRINHKQRLLSAGFCYSSALRADARCIDARLGKAMINVEKGNFTGAISEYKYVLKLHPNDLEVVNKLAEVYVDNGEVELAKRLYEEIFAHYQSPANKPERAISWHEVNAYVTLYEYNGQYAAAISELKSLSRWLLGRESQTFWDGITEDDREWDADSSRRIEVPNFSVDAYPLSTYGEGLPLELRVKLGLCRLNLGHHKEALVRIFLCSQ